MLKRFDDFTYIFLVNASQMAYLEEAQKTHAMLQKFNELYRYMIRSGDAALLTDELKALRDYIDIQTIRYESRFSISLVSKLENSDIYVKHLYLLDYVDNIMNNALAQFEGFFNVRLEIEYRSSICMSALLEAGEEKATYTITLTEEVK